MNSQDGQATKPIGVARGVATLDSILKGGPKPRAIKAADEREPEKQEEEAKPNRPELLNGRRVSRRGHPYFAVAVQASA